MQIIKIFARSFKNSLVSGIISSSAPETSSGIQATFSKNIEVLQYLKPNGSFSIRKWLLARKVGYLSQRLLIKE